ncbi:MAG: nitrilase-related carbon-nitrogen hydrolase [Actinomycetota bacterium]
MSRYLTVAAAQMGPVQRHHTREQVVERLVALLRQAHGMGAELVVFPELALTTFFPRWFVDDISEADHWYERSMPNVATQPLFDEAKRLGVGFCLGYALLDAQGRRWNV